MGENERTRSIAFNNEILRGIVGSTCHGTAIDGQDDRDEMGIFIEPPRNVCGLLDSAVPHYNYRTAGEGQKSGPTDTDLIMYSLRRYCSLAFSGNPSVILLMWLPQYINKNTIGDRLIEIRDSFVSRAAGNKFLGYLVSQRMKLTGERSRNVNRPELVEKYGFDTKFAHHAARLGYQGIEYLTERKIILPIKEPWLTTLRDIRTGKVSYEDTLCIINELESRLTRVVSECNIEADRESVEDFLSDAHKMHWGW